MGHNLGAVAFDLDGTLYPNYRLNIRLIPFILRNFPLLIAFGHARDRLRGKHGPQEPLLPGEDFYAAQARLIKCQAPLFPSPAASGGASPPSPSPSTPSRLTSPPSPATSGGTSPPGGASPPSPALRATIDRLIYRGWAAHFSKIKLYPHVRETLQALRQAGFKLAILSDFPPEEKLRRLGLEGLWDVVLCSEVVGALKPGVEPFNELARRLDMDPARILYVGNSVSYDIRGAKNAGFKAALISPPVPFAKKRLLQADFTFFDYRKLTHYVLG
jgi:putative hydrolase of the HAD superfamily